MKRFLSMHLMNFRGAEGPAWRAEVQLVIRTLATVILMVGTVGLARAADELPSQEQALALALENHPEIVAAKAKVSLVEAELYGKRMEVSRQVLGLYGNLKTLDGQVDAAKVAVQEIKANFAGHSSANSIAEIHAAEGKLVQATAQREQAERELRLLIGNAAASKETKLAKAAAVATRQVPLGPIVGTWKGQAEQPIKISFNEIPLTDVVKYLADKTGIKFSVQQPAFDDAGLGADMPISWNTNNVSLAAALQGFEDAYPQLQFVLRDYGVLLTTKDYAQEHGYMPVSEIGKEPTGVKPR